MSINTKYLIFHSHFIFVKESPDLFPALLVSLMYKPSFVHVVGKERSDKHSQAGTFTWILELFGKQH